MELLIIIALSIGLTFITLIYFLLWRRKSVSKTNAEAYKRAIERFNKRHQGETEVTHFKDNDYKVSTDRLNRVTENNFVDYYTLSMMDDNQNDNREFNGINESFGNGGEFGGGGASGSWDSGSDLSSNDSSSDSGGSDSSND